MEPTLESYIEYINSPHPFVQLARKVQERYVDLTNKYRGKWYTKSRLYKGYYKLYSVDDKHLTFTAKEDCYDHWAKHELNIPVEFFSGDEKVWEEYEAEIKSKLDAATAKQEKADLEHKRSQLAKLKAELGED